MMGGTTKKRVGLKQPVVYHASIPAHIRSLAQNLTSGKGQGRSGSSPSGNLNQSVGFIASSGSPTRRTKSASGTKSKSPARHSSVTSEQSASPTTTSPAATRRPTSLQTNVSSGYESEYQSSIDAVEVSWGWTAAEVIWKWQNNNLKTKKVYTDWANHYLDKAKCKKHIQDLQVDVTDGVVLAEVIEAVTNQKIADINRKPKTSLQMIENIRTCLNFLGSIGVGLDGITPKDIRDGNLKAILGLFFSLSRHKQRQKQQHQLSAEKEKLQRLQQEQRQHGHTEEMPQPRLPSPYNKQGGPTTSIPVPAAALARRGGLEKTRQQGVPLGGGLQPPSNVIYKCTSASSSRSTSPSGIGTTQFISIPRPSTIRNSLTEKQLEPNGLKHPSLSGSRTSLRIPAVTAYNNQSQQGNPSSKNSMLDKFKLFNAKDKDTKLVNVNSKRTSSSSGFSSAKSEHSDSSTSLSSDVRQTGNISIERTEYNGNTITNNHSINDPSNSPKSRGIRAKLSKINEKKQGSPKLKRMMETETRAPKQLVKPDKLRGVADGERKTISCIESASQDRLNDLDKHQQQLKMIKQKPSPTSKPLENGQTYQENPSKMMAPNSTGIPKPMAAVKGTTKPPSTTGDVVVSPLKVKSPSIPRISIDASEKQKRDDVCVALVSPMRTSVTEEITMNGVDEEKPTPTPPAMTSSATTNEAEKQKIIKDVDEEEVMSVKPMSPLMNGYRLAGGHSGLHFTHPGYMNNSQSTKSVYYSHGKVNGNANNLESIDLATGYMSDGEILRTMNTANLMQDATNGYVSDGTGGGYGKKKDGRLIVNPAPTSEKVNGFHDNTAAVPPRQTVVSKKSQNSTELSSEQDIYSQTKGVVGQNQWPTQGDFQQSPVGYRSGIAPGQRTPSRKSESGQQTDASAFRPVPPGQWKKYPPDDANKLEDHIIRSRERRSSPVANGIGRKSKGTKGMGTKDDGNGSGKAQQQQPQPQQQQQQPVSDNKGKVRGVPSSFGYVKRSTSGTSGGNKSEARTAQVSAVPRTKVKVSGGTQTTSDLAHFKSYSLTGSTANQLSQCVRDRILGSQSLPKPGSSDYAALFHQHRQQQQQQQRQHKPTDGSLSDTTYSTYSEIHNYYSNNSPYSSWLRNNSAYTASLPTRTSSGLVDAESLESLSSLPAQLQHRASLTHARMLMGQREGSASPSHRLNRSNSIRSTKSEKLYPSMLQRSDDPDPYYSIPVNSLPQKHNHTSQPTSPTPSQMSQGVPSRYNYPLSPISSSSSSHGLNRGNLAIYSPGNVSKVASNEDDIHGSSVSLVSTASSLYSTAEEKQAHEIRKLRRELLDSQEKVYTLTSQLSTNAHVVSAFEQSLSSMTQRLQHLTATTEKKDQELLELRKNIELLRKQSQEAIQNSNATLPPGTPCLSRRHTMNPGDGTNGLTGNGVPPMTRQLSTDSVSSLNSLSSACSLSSSANCSPNNHHNNNSSKSKKKKKGWLRSSFSKAFSRSRKNRNGSVSDVEDFRRMQVDHDVMNNTDISAPSSPLLNNHPTTNGSTQNLKVSQSSSAIYKQKDDEKEENEEMSECDLVEDLKKQLREKDLVLTDIRLEALSSAHQLESLKDTVIKMRNELLNLKQDNERLQRIVTSKSLTSSQSSVNHMGSLERRFSLHEGSLTSLSQPFVQDTEGGKRVIVSVLLGPHGVYHKYMEENCKSSETVIAAIYISPKTQWEMLDNIVRRVFKEYVQRIDPATALGLSGESIWSYHLGEIVRYKDSSVPDLLPCAFLVEEEDTLRICLKGAMHNGSLDALAFEALIPKSIIQRYVSLLTEHRRIILCGPSGTGKSYLANKLAEFLVSRSGKDSTAESVATFNVDHKNSKELRQYLTNVAEQCEANAADLPLVIILDNLHQAASLGEVFNGFLSSKYSKCPFIIGTMNQATCSTTNLQLHHNFRWILCANHMEPVKGFLGRYLRRRTLDTELRENVHNNDFARIIDWIPKIWQHLNKFIEMHNSSDVTIGPRLFISCPGTVESSQVWFTDLWNYAIVPYLMDAVREGLQLYGKRTTWEDPTQFVLDTYPWADESIHGGPEALLRIRPEDVGFDMNGPWDGNRTSAKAITVQNEVDGDPLLNMLMRLQEAANYSNGQMNGMSSPDHQQTTANNNNTTTTTAVTDGLTDGLENNAKMTESCI